MARPQHEQLGFLLLKYALKSGEQHSQQTAADLTQQHGNICGDYLGIMHKAQMIHITRWTQPSAAGRSAPVYAWGKWKDAPKPVEHKPQAAKEAAEEGLPGGIWRVLFGNPVDHSRASRP